MTTKLPNSRGILGVGLLAASCLAASAQPIKPVWEYTLHKLPAPLPVLTNYVPWTSDQENGDGMSLMDCIGPMRRYDANRYLLGIRENGIDESGASGAYDTNLANAYPDRSLIWINPTNGQPMGLALNIGLFPVPLDPEVAAAGGTPGCYYWSFDVSDDGYIYSGYKNQLLRYAPNGSGGFSPTPTVVFTITGDIGTNVLLMTESQWRSYYPETVRVRGSGANTKVLVGCGGNRGIMLLTTTDGNTFSIGAYKRGGYGSAADNASSWIPSKDPSFPDDIWFYGGAYPFNSDGLDKFYRAVAAPPWDVTTMFFSDGSFSAQVDTSTNTPHYTAQFCGSVDANPDLGYVVNYQTPPYNSPAVGPHAPGWLAIHDATNGTFIASYKFPFTDLDEYLTGDQSMLWMGCHGSVSIYPAGGNKAEVLWTSEVFGYGRYLVDPSVIWLKSTKTDVGIVLEWNGGGILQSASNVTGPYTDLPDGSGFLYTGPAPQFFRVMTPQQ